MTPRRVLPLLASALLLGGCGGGLQAERATGGYVQGDYGISVVPVDEREPAPEVSGETLDGEPIALDDFAGQVVLINIWGSWCGDCRVETDDLVEAEAELRADGVAFLGIDIRDDRSAALRYEAANDVTWPSIYDPSSSALLGFRGSMTAASTPTTYVVDEEGRLAARLLGAQSAGTFVGVVEDVSGGGG
jgi:thiol-disulfide isomerase/thioredoxin